MTRKATVAEVVLEKILKRAIIVKDIAGGVIYDSGKYGGGGNDNRRRTELIYHNGHAWSKDLHLPQERNVWIYEGGVWANIRLVTGGRPIAVWLLGGEEGWQFHVIQFVLEDGRVFRTMQAHERLFRGTLAEKVFGENHAARENNGWKPTPASLLEDIQKACAKRTTFLIIDARDQIKSASAE